MCSYIISAIFPGIVNLNFFAILVSSMSCEEIIFTWSGPLIQVQCKIQTKIGDVLVYLKFLRTKEKVNIYLL